MTETTADVPALPHEAVAIELLGLTALIDRAQARIAELKEDQVARWGPGSKQTLNLPGARANTFRKIGEVRQDGGHTEATVADADAWFAWCEANVAHNIAETRESKNGWTLDPKSIDAIDDAFDAAYDMREGAGGGFGGASKEDLARALLDTLEGLGYTLTEVTVTPSQAYVMESWTQGVLKASMDAKAPVLPNGDQLPDDAGIRVAVAAPRNVVVLSAKKNTALVDEWISTVRQSIPNLLGMTETPGIEQ